MTADTCCATRTDQSKVCPRNGRRGRAVRRSTVDSLLTDEARARLSNGPSLLCLDPDCPVVYFGPAGLCEKDDLGSRVGFKERTSPRPICYCFGHTIESIEEEIHRTGRSTILESIKAGIKAGRCRCETKNPKGTCCLVDVAAVLKASRQ